MKLPSRVSEYLQQHVSSGVPPVCFQLDSSYRLLNSWGDTQWLGFSSLDAGADMLREAPYLFESLVEVPNVMEFVSSPSGSVLHVHTIPAGESHFVVLLDARESHAATRAQQQSVNELRLLHTSQQRLIRRQRDLISELVETKVELDHHRRDAERSSESKSQFIAMMSHEFRTPLASIVNYADLAAEPNIDKNTARQSIEAIARSAHHLNSLVDTILDDARLDAGRIELLESNFDLHELLHNLSAMMAPLAADKELSFVNRISAAVPQMVRADDIRLRQILINLLSNAIKFTDQGGVKLMTKFADGRIISSITDSGPGIGLADQDRVFHAFERAQKHSGKKGAGLGLSISLRLAKLMGGDLTLDSKPGQGCKKPCTVPVAESGEAIDTNPNAYSAPVEPTIATTAVSVLLCDDDEDMLALAKHYLHQAGLCLVIARSGEESLSRALTHNPDIILMDCNLPGISGIDAANRLRQSGFLKPIVALTASRLSAADMACFTHCFRKPASMQDILAEVKLLTNYA